MKTLVRDYWFGRQGCLASVLSVVVAWVATAWYFRIRQQDDPGLWLDLVVFVAVLTLVDMLFGTLAWMKDRWRGELRDMDDGGAS